MVALKRDSENFPSRPIGGSRNAVVALKPIKGRCLVDRVG